MDKKSLFYPDRVLSLVVIVLSMFMIMGVTYLHQANKKSDLYTSNILRASNEELQSVYMNRAMVAAQDQESEE